MLTNLVSLGYLIIITTFMRRNTSSIIFGSILVLLGVGFLANEFIDGFDIGEIIQYVWPSIFVLLGLKLIVDNPKSPFGGIIFLVLGGAFFVEEIFDFNVWRLWPVILIVIGLSVIFPRLFRSNAVSIDSSKKSESKTVFNGDEINKSVAFWGAEETVTSQNFTGGAISVAFGGMELDLSQAKFKDGTAELRVTVGFGALEVEVGDNVKVVNNTTAFLAGVENKVRSSAEADQTLIINGNVFFGAVEIED